MEEGSDGGSDPRVSYVIILINLKKKLKCENDLMKIINTNIYHMHFSTLEYQIAPLTKQYL